MVFNSSNRLLKKIVNNLKSCLCVCKTLNIPLKLLVRLIGFVLATIIIIVIMNFFINIAIYKVISSPKPDSVASTAI